MPSGDVESASPRASVARGLAIIAVIASLVTAFRLLSSGCYARGTQQLVCMEPVELVVDGEPRLACTTELSSCGASAGDRVMLAGDLCRIDRGAMSGAMRLVAGLPIDLNRATAADLELLDGIGPQLAAAVVACREANGPFLTVDDLVLVRGIGPATLATLKPYVTVSFDR